MKKASSIEMAAILVAQRQQTEEVDEVHRTAAASVLETLPDLQHRPEDAGLGAEQLFAAHHEMTNRGYYNLTGSVTERRSLPGESLPLSPGKFSLPYCDICTDRTGECECCYSCGYQECCCPVEEEL